MLIPTLNRVIMIGKIWPRDARITGEGERKRASFSVVVTSRFKHPQTLQWESTNLYVNIIAWIYDKTGELLTTGKVCYIEGELKSYRDVTNEKAQWYTYVHVHQLRVLGEADYDPEERKMLSTGLTPEIPDGEDFGF